MSTNEQPKSPFFNRFSLRTKVTLVLLVISLGPVLITGFVHVNRALERGEKSESAHFAQSANFSASAFADLFSQLRRELEDLARRFPAAKFDAKQIQSRLTRTGALLPDLPQWRDAPFFNLVGRDFSSFFIALPDSTVFYSHPFRNVRGKVRLAQRQWVANLLPNGGLGAGPLPELTGANRPVTVMLVPLYDRLQNRVGTLGAVIDHARLHDIADRMFRGHATLEGRGALMLATDDLLIVAHNESAKIGRTVSKAVAEHPAGRTHQIDREDGQYLVAYAPVIGTPWKVYVIAPIDQVYRFLHLLIRVLIIVSVLTFVFIVLLADYLARVLMRPIEELQRGAEMIGSGVLDYRIDLSNHRTDELGRLALSFNQMGDNLYKTQKQVKAYARSLEAANEELDAMVFAITHDLKKSLRGIEAYSNFLEKDFGEALGVSGREMLSSIHVNVERMAKLSNDLVGLVEAERDKGENTIFSLEEILLQVRNSVLDRHNGEILINGPMPEVLGDRARIALVFKHLIENGLKFNRYIMPCVEVSARDDNLFWHIEVTDNGIGIPPSEQENVFDLFYRLHEPDQFSGSGTGLNIARRIIDDHRGEITIHEAPHGGTRVAIRLPKDGGRLTSPGFRITADGQIQSVR